MPIKKVIKIRLEDKEYLFFSNLKFTNLNRFKTTDDTNVLIIF